MSQGKKIDRGGPIGWMVSNKVTPNILMLMLIVGGFLMSSSIKKEVFPEFDLDVVTVQVAYPGASPEEVEQGIVLAVEEAVRGIDGVKEVQGTANEGSGAVMVELIEGSDQQKIYQEIQQEIDRIRTFPLDAEEPQVSLLSRRREVITLQIYGNVSESALRDLAEHVRDLLLQDSRISVVELEGARELEVRVEVPQANLRAYNFTLSDVARRIQASAVEVPGGSVRTDGGEILMRVDERRDWAREFADIPIVSSPEGTVVSLADIATLRDTFEETNRSATYAGKRTIGIRVYRIGDQTPTAVSEAVRDAMTSIESELPPGVDYAINNDESTVYQQRLSLLLRNGFMGLVLVLLILGLFLEFKLAFWVTMGIPTSFLGGMLFLPGLDVSINVVSMFAFIIALGIVVDDAIIAGENIYEMRQQGMSFLDAAIQGARDVSTPVAFSILTNIVTFIPLYMIPGTMGKIFSTIPIVVASVFLISWVESLLILPAHLAHGGGEKRGITRFLHEKQQAFSQRFLRFVEVVYAPFLNKCIRARYVTVSVAIGILILVLGYAASGRMGMVLMPTVESDSSVATAVLPVGSPMSQAELVRDRLVNGAQEVADEHGGGAQVTGVYAVVNENEVEVFAYLTDPDVRPLSTSDFTQRWRERVGTVSGLESLRYQSDRGGPGSGASITIELSHRDIDVLDRASSDLARELAQFSQTRDIDDGYSPGKRQLDFEVSAEGYGLGLTGADIAAQVRNAFFGAQALRQQRGRNEVRVYVSLPEEERVSEHNVEHLVVRTPAGRDVALRQVADIQPGRAYTSITRRNGRRTVSVTANVEPPSETNQVLSSVTAEALPGLQRDYPGLLWGFEGRQADMTESLSSLYLGFTFAMMGVYILLAIPFRSYTQPLIVMVGIPFGVVGAVIGHVVMGYSLSVISMMGIVALSGVVVNDSLVLVKYANDRRDEGMSSLEAVHAAGVRRFRPILLTTLTTFGGLAPMIFETSRQARFIIPMALSLGFGILFATGITLVILPSLYLILEDVNRGLRTAFSRARGMVAAVAQ